MKVERHRQPLRLVSRRFDLRLLFLILTSCAIAFGVIAWRQRVPILYPLAVAVPGAWFGVALIWIGSLRVPGHRVWLFLGCGIAGCSLFFGGQWAFMTLLTELGLGFK